MSHKSKKKLKQKKTRQHFDTSYQTDAKDGVFDHVRSDII